MELDGRQTLIFAIIVFFFGKYLNPVTITKNVLKPNFLTTGHGSKATPPNFSMDLKGKIQQHHSYQGVSYLF